jgi:hypothetical protein
MELGGFFGVVEFPAHVYKIWMLYKNADMATNTTIV